MNEVLGDNDIRFDYDLIMQSISNRESHEYSDEHLPFVVEYRGLIIEKFTERKSLETAYIIATKITDKLIEELEGKKDVEYVLIDTSKEQCYKNLEGDETRPDKDFWKEKIDSWFEWHEDYLKEVNNNLNRGHKKTEQQNKKFWDMKMSANSNDEADIFIYGEITKYAWEEYGEVSSITFKNELDELGEIDKINLYINSPGGSVFEGLAIYNMLKRHKARIIVHVDAVAASIASVIAMAGDEIIMPSNSLMMIHNAWTYVRGNSSELRKQADDLDRINQSAVSTYLDKAGGKLSEEKLKELLDEETWLSAEEAFNYGLCTEVTEANDMAASISDEYLQQYKNVPKQLKEVENKAIPATEMAERNKIAEQAELNLKTIEQILGGIY